MEAPSLAYYKLLVLGNTGVGKTVFLLRYNDDKFQPAFISTVGIDWKKKTVQRYY